MGKKINFIKLESVKIKMLEHHCHHYFESPDTTFFYDYYYSRILSKVIFLHYKATKVYFL